MAAHRVCAALALAEVVVDVDCPLHIWAASGDFLHNANHQVQHVGPICHGIVLAPLHVLHSPARLGVAAAGRSGQADNSALTSAR